MTNPATNHVGAASAAPVKIRVATPADVDAIVALSAQAYAQPQGYTAEQVSGQLENAPGSAFVATIEDRVAGYAACFRVSADRAFVPHTWHSLTGGGDASRADPDGRWLYGMECCVAPAHRNRHIGRRLYDRRKALCSEQELDGIVCGARMPDYGRRRERFSGPLAYARAVAAGRLRDSTLSFQLANGFELVDVLPMYLPHDAASAGCGALLAWRNPRRRRPLPRHSRRLAAARAAAAIARMRRH